MRGKNTTAILFSLEYLAVYLLPLFINMSKRGETWSNEETSALIAIWGDQEIQKKLSNCHKNSDIYKIISDKLEKVNGYERDLGQCRTKIKHLKIMYKKYKDSLASSGAGRRKPPKFFDELDRFLGDKPDATGIENSIDISDSTSEISNEVEDESVGYNDIGKLLKLIV